MISIKSLVRGGLMAAAVVFTLSMRGAFAPDFGNLRVTPAGPQPRTMMVANLNGDAYPDAVVGSWDVNKKPIGGMAVLFGQPAGQWIPAQTLLDQQQVQDLAAGDFDADGDEDVAWKHSNGT
ncbi:MAG: FG-GAP repeat domain-containing protein, partial [Thermoanaerobaculia bacterium]